MPTVCFLLFLVKTTLPNSHRSALDVNAEGEMRQMNVKEQNHFIPGRHE